MNSMYKKLTKVIVKHPREAFISEEHLQKNWGKYGFSSEPIYDESVAEYDDFLEILSENVSEIMYLPRDENVGMDSIYSHDPVKFTPKGAVILNSGKKLRQLEARALKNFLIDNNIPIIGELTGEAVCDGGDIVWLNNKTVAIGRGYRTNNEAIKQLTAIFEPLVDEVKIIQLPHDLGEEACLHLMSFLSVVDKDLAVVYSRLMPVELREWLLDNDFKLVEVPVEEYENLGCNVLAIAPRVCLLVEGNPVTEKNLIASGATVYSYKGIEISVKGTGGPTCLTCPVERI